MDNNILVDSHFGAEFSMANDVLVFSTSANPIRWVLL